MATTSKKRQNSKMQALGDLLPQSLRAHGLDKDFYQWQVFSFWDRAVGKPIARQTYPNKFYRGVLHVLVSTASWVQELQFMKQEIIERLNRELENQQQARNEQLDLNRVRVSGIKFMLGKIPAKAKERVELRKVPENLPPATPEQIALVEEETKAAQDPELRELLKNALLNAKRRRSPSSKAN